MDWDKTNPVSSNEKGKYKKSESFDPDSAAFKELMKVGKAKEPEFEEKKKKRKKQEEEETQEEQSPDIYSYKKLKTSKTEINDDLNLKNADKTAPQSPAFYKNSTEKKLSPEEEKQVLKALEKELKNQSSENASSIELSQSPQKAGLSLENTQENAREKEIKQVRHSYFAKEEKLDENLKALEKKFLKKQRETLQSEKETSDSNLNPQKQESVQKQVDPSHLKIPDNIQVQAAATTAKVEPFIHQELHLLFERMIGTIIFMNDKDISTTQIILNNPEFENSRFFNTTITFERYATAPNSFNIKLTGSQEAVTIFNENVEGLYKAFSNADLNFDIGNISAEYKYYKPLFQRKPPVQDGEDKK